MKDPQATSNVLSVHVHIDAEEDASAEEVDLLTRQLRKEIQEIGIESAELVKDEMIPEGAKSAEAITIGALLIAVLPAVLPKLIEFLQAWSMRGENRRVQIKTQIGDRLVEAEFSPTTMSHGELKHLIETLIKAVDVQKNT